MTNQIKLTAHGMRTAIGPSCSLLPFNPEMSYIWAVPLDGGHFLLESQLDTVTGYIRGFLGRTFSAVR